MCTCLSVFRSYVMALTVGLRDYLKTTRVGKCFLSVFGYFYVRWRVMRTTSPELEEELDSHDSSYYEAQRRRITRTKSVYNSACPTSLRNSTARQKPTCIEVYRQFMDYGSTDDTIPGHIFLSNSASYYASPNVTLCQVSLLGTDDEEDESSISSSYKLDETNNSHSESSPTKEEIEACRLYQNWMSPVHIRRILPLTPIETSQNQSSSQKFTQNSYECYQNLPSSAIDVTTYPEKQRRVNNYFFTKPMFFENNELRIREGDRRAQKHLCSVAVEQPSDDSQDHLDKVAKWVESESFNLRTDSISSELAPVVPPEHPDSPSSSDYRTVSISSPVAKEISERFSTNYWSVESHNEDGAIGAKDNYHNRYFGKAGYYLTRNAINNHCNTEDAMPAVEKRALQTERRWTGINERGRNYDNVELGFPDTNGLQTDNWNDEYEQPLPPHTCGIWKAPKTQPRPSLLSRLIIRRQHPNWAMDTIRETAITHVLIQQKVEKWDNEFQLKCSGSTPSALDQYMEKEEERIRNYPILFFLVLSRSYLIK